MPSSTCDVASSKKSFRLLPEGPYSPEEGTAMRHYVTDNDGAGRYGAAFGRGVYGKPALVACYERNFPQMFTSKDGGFGENCSRTMSRKEELLPACPRAGNTKTTVLREMRKNTA